MATKRSQKASKRAKREARRQTRRAQRQARPADPPRAPEANPLIGYLVHNGVMPLCDGDACLITGSRRAIQQIVDRQSPRFSDMTIIQAAPFSDILRGMQRGGAYCFDEAAYGRFLEPARRIGMPLSEEDFSDPGPLGMHFVRVQWMPIGRLATGAQRADSAHGQ
jgi:hypothetical protein